MKAAVILSDGVSQIMLTPENEVEKLALKLITPDKEISVEAKIGTLYDEPVNAAKGYVVSTCQGGYMRAYKEEDSLMLVIKPKKNENDQS